jgi:hypothetical protein
LRVVGALGAAAIHLVHEVEVLPLPDLLHYGVERRRVDEVGYLRIVERADIIHERGVSFGLSWVRRAAGRSSFLG